MKTLLPLLIGGEILIISAGIISRMNTEGDIEDPGELLWSYEKLLIFLGFKPDYGRMYLGDGLIVLQFEEVDVRTNVLNGQ